MIKDQISDAKLMEIGAAVHSGIGPGQAARDFNLSKTTIYRALRHYERETGHRLIGPSVVQKAAMKRAGIPIPAIARANGNALAHVGEDWQRRAVDAEARADKLRDELETAIDEAHTLQRIIITLGRAL
jgi:hypothetical protein